MDSLRWRPDVGAEVEFSCVLIVQRVSMGGGFRIGSV